MKRFWIIKQLHNNTVLSSKQSDSFSLFERVISNHDPTWMFRLWSSRTHNFQSSSLLGRGIICSAFSSNSEKYTIYGKAFFFLFLLNASLLPVWTPISTLLSLIYWCRVVLHSSGIDIMLVKSRERFVDLSLTPTQFLASNFLITEEHEFSPKKTQLETRMCNYSRMKVWGSSIT